jgi:hypothetical protein
VVSPFEDTRHDDRAGERRLRPRQCELLPSRRAVRRGSRVDRSAESLQPRTGSPLHPAAAPFRTDAPGLRLPRHAGRRPARVLRRCACPLPSTALMLDRVCGRSVGPHPGPNAQFLQVARRWACSADRSTRFVSPRVSPNSAVPLIVRAVGRSGAKRLCAAGEPLGCGTVSRCSDTHCVRSVVTTWSSVAFTLCSVACALRSVALHRWSVRSDQRSGVFTNRSGKRVPSSGRAATRSVRVMVPTSAPQHRSARVHCRSAADHVFIILYATTIS